MDLVNKFTYQKQYNTYYVSHGIYDYAEIYKDYTDTWVIEYYNGKDLGYTLRHYFRTLKAAKSYLDEKFNELVY